VICRKAEYEDAGNVASFLARMQPQTRYKEPPVNEASVKGLVLGSIAAKRAVCYVTEDKGEICGVLVGLVMPYVWNEAFFYATDYLFVAEKGGNLILQKFIRWCKKPRVLEIKLGESAGSTIAGPLYEAVGFKQVGGIYEMRLK